MSLSSLPTSSPTPTHPSPVNPEEREEVHLYAWIIAGTCAVWATVISLHLMYKHFRNYSRPELQRPMIRIILMCPIYSLDSFLSLRFRNYALYFDLFRDCYEAYVLYMFFTLLMNFLESKVGLAIEDLLEEKPPMRHPTPLCCFTFKPGKSFLMWSKFGVLQFTLVKPLLTLVAVILEAGDLFDEGSFAPSRGFLYITMLDNVSITISLYYLVLFYMATKDELQDLNPVPKFLCIKAIIFFSFWQGVVIAIIAYFGAFHTVGGWTVDQVTMGLQDFLICVEMFIISIVHSRVFGYQPFRIADKEAFFKGILHGKIREQTAPIVASFKDAMHPKYDIESSRKIIVPVGRKTMSKLRVERIPLMINSAPNDYDSE